MNVAIKLKPEALKSNIHGNIRGGMNLILLNRGVAEDVLKKRTYLPDFLQHLWCCKLNLPFTMDVTMEIGIGCLRYLPFLNIPAHFNRLFMDLKPLKQILEQICVQKVKLGRVGEEGLGRKEISIKHFIIHSRYSLKKLRPF